MKSSKFKEKGEKNILKGANKFQACIQKTVAS